VAKRLLDAPEPGRRAKGAHGIHHRVEQPEQKQAEIGLPVQFAQAVALPAVRRDLTAVLLEQPAEAREHAPAGELFFGDGLGAWLGHAPIKQPNI
jgi:hypothetical protein